MFVPINPVLLTVGLSHAMTGSIPWTPTFLVTFGCILDSLLLCAAPADYSEILLVIPIGLDSQNLSIPCASIVDDLALENTEEFSVNITTTDDFVAIGQDTTQVFILDNGQYKWHSVV